jgi:hypothetical protein
MTPVEGSVLGPLVAPTSRHRLGMVTPASEQVRGYPIGSPWPRGGRPPPPRPIGPGGFVLIMMLVAETLPSLLVVPLTAMKSPTLRALEFDVPEPVRKVVVEAYVTVCDVPPRVWMVTVSPESAVTLPPLVGRVIPAGGLPC